MALATDRFRGSGVRNAKILYDNAGSVAVQSLLFVRSIDPQPKVNTLNFEGDDSTEEVDTLAGLKVRVELDKFDVAAISRAYTKSLVTGIGGEDWRLYFGDNNEVAGGICGLQYDVLMRDEDAGTSEILRYVLPLGFMNVFKPSKAEYNAKHGMGFDFTAQRTTKDIAGNSLSGVPSEGVFFYLAKMT